MNDGRLVSKRPLTTDPGTPTLEAQETRLARGTSPPSFVSISPGLKYSSSTPNRGVMTVPTRSAPANASPLPLSNVASPASVDDVRTTSAPIAPATYTVCPLAGRVHTNTASTALAPRHFFI